MKLLSLDISMANTGFAVFEDSELDHYGVIPKPKYPLSSRDKYPKKTAKIGKLMAEEIFCLILSENPDIILIEEIMLQGKAGVKSIKGLAQTHGILLALIESELDKVIMRTPGEWRKMVGMKKNGDWKLSSVNMANSLYNIKLEETQHDSSDAILLGHSEVKNEA